MEKRIVFHIDFEYFYAQCEEIRNPKIKGKCVSVCIFSDRGGDSGAIATANYTARKFGVKPTGHAGIGAKVSVSPDWLEIQNTNRNKKDNEQLNHKH